MRSGRQEKVAGLGKRPESCLVSGFVFLLPRPSVRPSFLAPSPRCYPSQSVAGEDIPSGLMSELSTTTTTQLPVCELCLQESLPPPLHGVSPDAKCLHSVTEPWTPEL